MLPMNGEEALERQQHAPALAPVPGDVADVVVALARLHVGGITLKLRASSTRSEVGAVEAHEDAVEVQVLLCGPR